MSNSPTNTNTKYLDTTATALPNAFYHVTAVNAQGESGFCQELSIGNIASCPLGGSPCAAPFTIVDCAGAAGNVPTDPTSGELTIQNVSIGEPFTSCTDNSLTFVMRVQTLDPASTGMPVLPANSEWQIIFGIIDTSGNPETVFLEMDTFSPNTPATPRIAIGRRDPTATGTLDTRVCSASATSSCPQISAKQTADGIITFKLDVSSPLSFPAPGTPATGVAFTWDASKAGTKLGSVGGNTFLLAGAGAGFLETVQTTGVTGTYTRVGNVSCSNKPPIAMLSADNVNGPAPFTVHFDASGSSEPAGSCGTINSYTLDFGDGSTPVTQSTPTFTHTYNTSGVFPARLTVGDTVGQTSTNPAEVVITVSSANPIVITVQTSPPGRTFTVDGTLFNAARTFQWTSGSTHTIATTSPQSAGTGVRYAWNSWNTGGAISHTVSPTKNTTYIAKFTKQYQLTMNAGSGGTVTPASGWQNSGKVVSITGNPAVNEAFNNWTGSGTGSYSGTNNPASITMNGPITETAAFVQGPPASTTASPTQIHEGQTATYTVSVATAPSKPLIVKYKMSGTASRSEDYTLSGTFGQVTIPAGQTSATVTLTSLQDPDNGNTNEATETAIMTLQPGPGYFSGGSQSATVSIAP